MQETIAVSTLQDRQCLRKTPLQSRPGKIGNAWTAEAAHRSKQETSHSRRCKICKASATEAAHQTVHQKKRKEHCFSMRKLVL